MKCKVTFWKINSNIRAPYNHDTESFELDLPEEFSSNFNLALKRTLEEAVNRQYPQHNVQYELMLIEELHPLPIIKWGIIDELNFEFALENIDNL